MKFISRLTVFVLLTMVLTSCEFHCSVGTPVEKQPTPAGSTDKPSIANRIKLTTRNVKVSQAFLITANDNKPVPENNAIDFSQPVKLMLVIESGWTVENGLSFIGASEKVSSEGTVLLDEKDVFAEYESGVNATDAKAIGLSVTIPPPPKGAVNEYNVEFRVWDKKGTGYVEGSYTLHSK
jgi:hypothetical protein